MVPGAPFLASFARSGAIYPFHPRIPREQDDSSNCNLLLPPEPPHSHSHLHRINPRIQRCQPRIRNMQVPQLHAPVVLRTQHMRPQRRRRSKVHRVRIRRDIVICEQRPPTQLKKRRKPPPPLEIPLQPKRIESHSISRIRRLSNQIHRLRIHHVLKSPPQKSRQMLPGNHPPISQPKI